MFHVIDDQFCEKIIEKFKCGKLAKAAMHEALLLYNNSIYFERKDMKYADSDSVQFIGFVCDNNK